MSKSEVPMQPPPMTPYNLTPELIQQNVAGSKNRLNAVKGQANGMVDEVYIQEINTFAAIMIQLVQEIGRIKTQLDALRKKNEELQPNTKKMPPVPDKTNKPKGNGK